LFFFRSSSPPRDLHSFPTRRSSDLVDPYEAALPADKAASLGLRFMDLDQAMRECDILVMLVPHQAFRSYPRPDAATVVDPVGFRSEEHTSELQSRENLVCRLLLEKK